MSSENSSSGACRNSGASRSENGTGTPPAARTAPACARASRSPRLRATHRSGCGIALMTPKSGHVPTTTTAPLPRSRRTALASRRADGPMPFSLRDVVGTDHDHRGIRRRARHEHGVDLTRQALRRRADDRLGAQPDPLAGLLGQPAGDQHAGHFFGAQGAVSGRGGVAEHHQMQVERHAAVPALHRTAAGGVDAVGAGRDVPGLRDDASGLVSLPAQEGAGSDVGGACRCERGRGREGDGRATRCTDPHADSLLANFGVIRVARRLRRSRCGIKSGIKSVSLIVEPNAAVQAKLPGLASKEPYRALRRRRKWWR